jgi:hypothetical protein
LVGGIRNDQLAIIAKREFTAIVADLFGCIHLFIITDGFGSLPGVGGYGKRFFTVR